MDAGADAGFDIYSSLRRRVTTDVSGFAVLNVAGTSRLYEVALLTGSASDRGKFSSPVTDIAIQLDQGADRYPSHSATPNPTVDLES